MQRSRRDEDDWEVSEQASQWLQETVRESFKRRLRTSQSRLTQLLRPVGECKTSKGERQRAEFSVDFCGGAELAEPRPFRADQDCAKAIIGPDELNKDPAAKMFANRPKGRERRSDSGLCGRAHGFVSNATFE
jgi:hypothetical protein